MWSHGESSSSTFSFTPTPRRDFVAPSGKRVSIDSWKRLGLEAKSYRGGVWRRVRGKLAESQDGTNNAAQYNIPPTHNNFTGANPVFQPTCNLLAVAIAAYVGDHSGGSWTEKTMETIEGNAGAAAPVLTGGIGVTADQIRLNEDAPSRASENQPGDAAPVTAGPEDTKQNREYIAAMSKCDSMYDGKRQKCVEAAQNKCDNM